MEDRIHEWEEVGHPKKRGFLAAFVECGAVLHACDIAGLSKTTHYRWLQEDPVYAACVARAELIAGEELEQVARERAKAGSDTLLIFLLKGLKPDKYGDSIRLRKQVEQLSDDDIDAIIASGKALAAVDSAGEGRES
jgi:hypothetical protein